MRTITLLDRRDAEAAITAMESALRRDGKAAVIAVADAHGDLLSLVRLDGAPASSVTIATNKAWTAAREGVPTATIGARLRNPAEGFDVAYYGDPRYCAWGGGLPVRDAEGRVVGSVAVSGLPENDDARYAELGVIAIRG